MVDSFLPSMRALVARRLSADSYSQGRIAALLGLTQASVSMYLTRDPKKHLGSLRELGVDRDEAERYAALLTEDLKKNPMYAVATLYSIWNGVIGAGRACGAHRQRSPLLAGCDVCMKVFGPERAHGETAIEQMESAVRMIESSAVFVRVMPEVSVNLAFAEEGASSAADVIAIPGRVVKVRGLARSFMRPEYGASTHLANVLLEVRRRFPGFGAAMNLRYDQRMGLVLKRMNAKQLSIGRSYPDASGDKVLAALKAVMSSAPEFDSVVDLGGAGLEPSLYVFADDAVDVARRALRIAQLYVKKA